MNRTFTLYILLAIFAIGNLFAQQSSTKTGNNGTQVDRNSKETSLKLESDSLNNQNKIRFVYNDGEQYIIKIQVPRDVDIKIEIFNMLAKPVKTVYEGKSSSDPDRIYDFNASTLPNGIYFAILQGNGFRHPYKFTIRR
jgi:hypothetical protein